MTDTMTAEQRHRCMSHIKGKGTKPELLVRRWLWRHGYRYRLNVKSVPGKPDIVMRPYRTAIFVNGCFWHGHNVEMRDCVSAAMRESTTPRSGKNLRDLQDLTSSTQLHLGKVQASLALRSASAAPASTKREQEYNEIIPPNSKCCKIPSTNRVFWVEKIRRNQERDERNYRVLQENGWQVIVVWECQLKPAARLERTMREVELLLNNNLLSLYKRHTVIPYSLDEDSPMPIAAEDTN